MLAFPALKDGLQPRGPSAVGGLSATRIELHNGSKEAGALWRLFHSIPRETLQSLLLNTVAFDRERPQNRIASLSDGGGGVYAFGLAVQNTGGRFVRISQLRQLIEDLETYVRAYQAYQRDNALRDKELRVFVDQVDSAHGVGLPNSRPKWINNDKKRQCVKEFIAALKVRYDRAKALDPTEHARLLQSPIYVGCSSNLAQRKPNYVPKGGKSSLALANKIYGLTLCLLSRRGIDASAKFVTVLRTWENGQLDLGERLVHALAGSYVHQGGFNIVEAGSAPERQTPSQLEDGRAYVLGDAPYLRHNLKASIAEMERRQAFQGACEELANAIAEAGVHEASVCTEGVVSNDLRRGLDDLLRESEQVHQAEQEAAGDDEIKRQLAAVKAEIEQLQTILGVFDSLDKLLE